MLWTSSAGGNTTTNSQWTNWKQTPQPQRPAANGSHNPIHDAINPHNYFTARTIEDPSNTNSTTNTTTNNNINRGVDVAEFVPRRNSAPPAPIFLEQHAAFNPLSPAFHCVRECNGNNGTGDAFDHEKQAQNEQLQAQQSQSQSQLQAALMLINSHKQQQPGAFVPRTRNTHSYVQPFLTPTHTSSFPQADSDADADDDANATSNTISPSPPLHRWHPLPHNSVPLQRVRSVSLSPACSFLSPLSNGSHPGAFMHPALSTPNISTTPPTISPLLHTSSSPNGLHSPGSPKSAHASRSNSPTITPLTPLTPPFNPLQLRSTASPPLSPHSNGASSPTSPTSPHHSRRLSGLSSSIPNLLTLPELINFASTMPSEKLCALHLSPPPPPPDKSPQSGLCETPINSLPQPTGASQSEQPSPSTSQSTSERSTTSWLPKTTSHLAHLQSPMGASLAPAVHSLLGKYRNPAMTAVAQPEAPSLPITRKEETALEALPPTLPANAPLPPGSLQRSVPLTPFPPPLPQAGTTPPGLHTGSPPPESLLANVLSQVPPPLSESVSPPSDHVHTENSYDRSPMEQFLLESNNKPTEVDNKIAEVSSLLESNLTLNTGCEFTPFPVPSDPPSASNSPLIPPKLPQSFISRNSPDLEDNPQRTRSLSLCSSDSSLFLHPYQFSNVNPALEVALQQLPIPMPTPGISQSDMQQASPHRLTQRTVSVPSRLYAMQTEKVQFTPGYLQTSVYSPDAPEYTIPTEPNGDPLGYIPCSSPNYLQDYRHIRPMCTQFPVDVDTLMARQRFAIHIDDEEHTNDSRTTLMIKNIPNKYSQRMLLDEIDAGHAGSYDFFYLPIDFKNKCNVGYAFINMISTDRIPAFYWDFNNKRWSRFNSEKICEITYARIQGLVQLVDHFKSSSLLAEEEKVRPVMLLNNELQPFPVGVSLRVMRGHRDVIVTSKLPYLV
ncbi:RNA recognition motif 2 [Pelomyxa schiedti]|nr:RNA recognition motif 2 [Pelomyxa schiedti]